MANDPSSQAFDPFAGPIITAIAPSTEPQREIWTACELGTDASLAFNESITVRLSGELDRAAFLAAFTELVARHEALRITLSGDGLTQCVGAPFVPSPVEHDFSDQGLEAGVRAVAVIAEQAVELPFDLTQGPLFRLHFARLAPTEHAFVLTAHHIICDGWSTAVLLRDWALFYNARRKGMSAALGPADAFSEYARQRASEGAEAHAKDEEYWLKQFAGEVPILDLPSDRPRPARKTYRAERADLVIDPELTAAVRKAGLRARASLFATLLGAFKLLVFRLTAQEDLVIGIPVAGQAAEGRNELVGHCVNMLPLRSTLRADEPFVELLGRVKKTLLDAQERQSFTFGTLLSKLPLARDPSRLPLVSVIFNVDRGMTSDAIGFDGIHAELKANARKFENFDLFLNAVEINGGIELECQYNADLFDRETIDRWLESYRLLLKGLASQPEVELGAVEILTSSDVEKLAEWNATDAEFKRDACVHELFEARAQQTPSAVACEFSGRELSFAELDARANRLATRLRELGVGRGTLVGLCLERGFELLVGLLGILKAGAGYVPLDPGYPAERLRLMVEDSGMPVLITDSALERELAFPVKSVLCMDREEASLAARSSEPLPKDARSAAPESVAYVIYTSGSTGRPKGVLVPHRAVVNLLSSVAKKPGLTAADRVLAITTLSFDIAVSEIWLPLVVGAKIVLVGREIAADGSLLREVCERAKVTFIDATPATYRLLLAAGWKGNDQLTLICTGEAMPKDLALELPNFCKAVWNGYGPTETTVWSTFFQVPSGCKRVLIGRPVDNTRIYVLDSRKAQVPIGVSGELYIAGSGVTHGYLNRPDLTSDRFVPDPFDPSGALMYRTGDVGRYLVGGDIECLGRNDNQVKLRGFRIELGEIEAALGSHEGVAEAAVILREDKPGDARLVAYAVARGSALPPPAELRAHLQKTLPDYMVPAAYVGVVRMPLTPSGKIDRRALPAPDASQQQAGAEFVAPRSETEKLLSELWSTALNVGRVSVHDDFFALGGHSLLASQILARLRRDHGIELSFRKFFEAPTVAKLAELIDGVPVAERTAKAAITRRAAGAEVPLSLAQERLWLLEEMHPAQRVVHNLPAAWRVRGPVDLARLQQSIDRLAQRHEMLRTSIAIDKNRATQRVATKVDLPIALVDLRDAPAAERERRMFEQIRKLTAEPFNLAELPLFRSTLFRLDDEEYVYFTVRHNIIWDGWSFDIFLTELCTTYAAVEQGVEPALPELPVSYGDYVHWHREWVKGPELARQVAFWQERLAGSPADLALPLDHRRPAQTTYAGANTAVSLSRSEADALTAVAHRAGTTVFNLVFAAYSIMLSRFSGQREVVVGTPVRARTLPEVEGIIGPFINAIVLRTQVDPATPFLDYLGKVRDITLDAFSNQEMPLELLGARPPMVRAFFSYQDARTRPLTLGSANILQVDVEPPAAATDLMLWIMERPNEMLAVANFSTEIFEPSTVQRLLQSFLCILRDVLAHPTRSIGELTLLDAEAHVESSPPSSRSARVESYLHSGLLEREQRQPDAIAYVHNGASSTYGELMSRARTIANALRVRVEAGTVVGIALPCSLDLVATVIGTLLSGCSVLAIDPGAPQAYLDRVVAGAHPGLIVTREAERARFGVGAPTTDLAELGKAQELPAAVFPSVHPALAPAWLELHFGVGGAPILTRTSHAELTRRLQGLTELVEVKPSSFASWVNPLAESLPLALLLGPALGCKTVLVDPQARAEQLLDAELAAGGEVVAFAPVSADSELSAVAASGRARLSAILDGKPDSESLQRLLPHLRRIVTVYAACPPHPVLFAKVARRADEAHIVGHALSQYGICALDPAQRRVPVGAVGELWLEASAPARLGLLGRIRSNGEIELLEDRQESVLVAGLRFDASEVGSVLERHPAVARAVVRLVASPSGNEQLVAYFVATSGQAFTETVLRRHVRNELPEPMVPQLFVELPSLPTTSDGALDLARLPSPFAARSRDDYVAPRTDAERLIAGLYAEALGLPRVGVYDNFFDLGGHSLLCFRVIGEIERKAGKRFSPRTLLLNSVEQVAAELVGVARASASAPVREAADPSVTGRVLKKLQNFLKR